MKYLVIGLGNLGRAIAESLRVTMWIGDKEAGAGTKA